jgi:hypothetical protein
MSTLRDELKHLEASGPDAIREVLIVMDEYDRRATMLGKYLSAQTNKYVNVWGNKVHQTAHAAEHVNFVNAMAEEMVPLSEYPAIYAFVLRREMVFYRFWEQKTAILQLKGKTKRRKRICSFRKDTTGFTLGAEHGN